MYVLKERRAFSLLTSIVVIVLMATVSILVMNLSAKMVKGTTTQFHREQAMLLAKSYTEYAIMAIMANDRTTVNCLTDINSDHIIRNHRTEEGYRARINISYIGTNAEVGTCPADNVLSSTVTTAETPVSVIIDVYIQYKDINHHVTNFANKPWITYHKRTLQKI